MNIKDRLRNFFFSDVRTSRLSWNILFSFLIKGYALLIQFALVPITLNYLDKFNYGIWLVLASILEWFSFFDIGIGHGLRNRLSETLALNDKEQSKVFISTAYALVSIIFTGFIVIFLVINPWLDWSVILNTPAERGEELSQLIVLVFVFFCIRFILSLISPIIFAKQDPALNSFTGPLGSTISLVTVVLISKYLSGSLFLIALIFSAAPLMVLMLFTLVLFRTRYKDIRPGFRYVDFTFANKLLGLGFGFFIIQISMLVLYSSTNMVLTQLYGPDEVTVYSIAYKYFTIPMMISVMITLPYWSTFTEAYYVKDISWIKESVRKLNIFAFLLILCVGLLYIFADQVIRFWVGDIVEISPLMKVVLVVYVVVYLLAAPYNIFINGVSKIRLQIYVAVTSILITIPLAIFFSKILALGPSGVVIAMVCSSLPGGILWFIQYRKIINGRASGIWNR